MGQVGTFPRPIVAFEAIAGPEVPLAVRGPGQVGGASVLLGVGDRKDADRRIGPVTVFATFDVGQRPSR